MRPMGTLARQLAPFAGEPGVPRVYADANMPNGVVAYMRTTLRWDVFFVMEHEELRRARDLEHYRLARQLDHSIDLLHLRLDAETEEAMCRRMHFPVGWDPMTTTPRTSRDSVSPRTATRIAVRIETSSAAVDG